MAEIVQAVRQAEAAHVDETGWREAGKKAWLRVGVTAGATAFGVLAREAMTPWRPCRARTRAATG